MELLEVVGWYSESNLPIYTREKQMKCPKCEINQDEVIDSRYKNNELGEYILRRRGCKICGHKWSTKEKFAFGPAPGAKELVEYYIEGKLKDINQIVLYTKTRSLIIAEKMYDNAIESKKYKSVWIKRITEMKMRISEV